MVVPVDDLCCSSYDVDSDIMKILWLAFAYARMTVVSVGGKENKKRREEKDFKYFVCCFYRGGVGGIKIF